MLRETFEKAQQLTKKIILMEFMKNKIEQTGSLNEIFRSELIVNYGGEIDQQFKDELLESVNQKLERLNKEFEQL